MMPDLKDSMQSNRKRSELGTKSPDVGSSEREEGEGPEVYIDQSSPRRQNEIATGRKASWSSFNGVGCLLDANVANCTVKEGQEPFFKRRQTKKNWKAVDSRDREQDWEEKDK